MIAAAEWVRWLGELSRLEPYEQIGDVFKRYLDLPAMKRHVRQLRRDRLPVRYWRAQPIADRLENFRRAKFMRALSDSERRRAEQRRVTDQLLLEYLNSPSPLFALWDRKFSPPGL